MEKIIPWVKLHKITVILAVGLVLLGLFGWLGVKQFIQKTKSPVSIPEVDLSFDAEGPYAILSPRRDGNALLLNLKRTSSYDAISYELAYTSNVDETTVAGSKILNNGGEDGGSSSGSIDRGVSGHIDTNEKKGEYE